MKPTCIGCDKPMPRGATWKGWHIVQRSAPGMGQHTYRNCGCLSTETFDLWIADLFEQGLEYPPPQWRATWLRLIAAMHKET